MTDHGTVSGYRGHWRDGTPPASPAATHRPAWQRAYEIRRYVNRGPLLIDSTGTIRRIQALVALGWPMAVLGERRGVTGRNLHRLLSQTRVHRDTAANIAALYDELSMTIGPSQRSRYLARGNGWAGAARLGRRQDRRPGSAPVEDGRPPPGRHRRDRRAARLPW
jgi:hypothetical protein